MNLLDALRDPALLASFFADRATWSAWQVFLAALFGLPLTDEDTALFRSHTGRKNAPIDPAKEAWVIVGRRGGKSRIAALIAVYLACFRDYREILAPGEVGTLPIVAADRRQARTVMGYVKGLVHGVPMLEQLVVNETADSIELSTGCRIEIHTASWRSIRGYTCVGAVLDEVSVWRSEDSANPDAEIVNALRPAMATVPGALLIAISSPYARRGVLWDQYQRHHGKDGDPVLTWQAATRAMNATVPETVIAEAYADDEAAAAAEYGAQFRSDLEAFVSREVIDACTVLGRYELAPFAGTRYVAFADPSGGSADSFTLAIAHAEQRAEEWVAVLDCIREVKPPFSPDSVVQEFAGVLKSYGCRHVVADKFAGAWVVEAFARHGIGCEQSADPKSTIYGNVLPLLNAGRVELLDLPRLRAQLLGLERRTGRSGKDSIDHPPGSHDDVANAVAGVLVACAAAPVRLFLAPDLIGGIGRPGRCHPFTLETTTLHDGIQIVRDALDLDIAAPRAVHISNGLPHGAVGLAWGYVRGLRRIERFSGEAEAGPLGDARAARNDAPGTPVERAPEIVVEGMLRIVPTRGGEVQLEDVVALILKIRACGVPIRWVTARSFGWVGPEIRLREAGISTGELFADDPKPYGALKSAVHEGRLEACAFAPFVEQLSVLEADDRTGVPQGAAREVVDAVAGCVHVLVTRAETWADESRARSSRAWAPGGRLVAYGDEGDLIEY